MKLKPLYQYPTQYSGSATMIELKCDCHGHVSGSGQRTGLTFVEEYPCYRLRSRAHPEYDGALVALTPDGLVSREVK